MKKIISVIMSVFLIILPLSVSAFAIVPPEDAFSETDYTNEELDLSQYTPEDLANMPPSELNALVAEFERVYDPLGTYEPEIIDTSVPTLPNEPIASPNWTSQTDGERSGCHATITAAACRILLNDKGFFKNTTAQTVALILILGIASAMPDEDEDDQAFAGHFFDPDTENNYLGNNDYTASTNAVEHFYDAMDAVEANNENLAFEEIGRCLHYVQDINVPHHAANIHVAYPLYGLSHSAFENFAYDKCEDEADPDYTGEPYLSEFTSIASSNYTTAQNKTVKKLVKEAATTAKSRITYVQNVASQSNWPTEARSALQNAARYSAMVLYRFAYRTSIDFYYN